MVLLPRWYVTRLSSKSRQITNFLPHSFCMYQNYFCHSFPYPQSSVWKHSFSGGPSNKRPKSSPLRSTLFTKYVLKSSSLFQTSANFSVFVSLDEEVWIETQPLDPRVNASSSFARAWNSSKQPSLVVIVICMVTDITLPFTLKICIIYYWLHSAWWAKWLSMLRIDATHLYREWRRIS